MRLNTKMIAFFVAWSLAWSQGSLAGSAPQTPPTDSVGAVLRVHGIVTLKNVHKEKRLAQEGTPVFLHDLIKTKKNSSVVLQMKDQTKIHVGPSSQLKITEFLFDEKKNALQGFIDLVRGQIHVLTAKGLQNNQLLFRTKNSAAGIRGTDFEMAYWRRIRFSFVAVNDGKVVISQIKGKEAGDSKSITQVEKGQCGWVIHDRKASEPKPMSEAPKWFKPIGEGNKLPESFRDPWPDQAREEMPGYPR